MSLTDTRRALALVEPRGLRAWLRLLGDAVAGRGGEPTVGPLRRAIVLLAVPMVLEMAMESVFAVVDIFFVSRLGANATAAVGLTESLLSMVYTVAAGLAIGATALVARRIGERDGDGAADAAVQVALLGLFAAALIGMTGVLLAPSLLRLMGATTGVMTVGAAYARVALGGSAAVLLLFVLNAALRGAGDATVAMRALWLANGLNMVLDPMLIWGIGPFPRLGVAGAAVATVLGRSAGVGLALAALLSGRGWLRVQVRHFRLRLSVMARVLRLSGTGMLQSFISTASWIGLIRILAGFGPHAVAGYTIAIRVVLFALLPAVGVANAAATMVGQGLGAGDPDRAEAAVWLAARMNLVFLGGLGALMFAMAPGITSVFGGDVATAAYAAHGLRIIATGFVFFAFGMVVGQAFNGAGDAWTPTLINLLCFWVLELPLGWVLAQPLGLRADGVFAAIAIAFSCYAVLGIALFRRGRWKLRQV